MTDDEEVETLLPDLTDITLADLPGLHPQLQPFLERLQAQVERPRINLGTGPPGRAD